MTCGASVDGDVGKVADGEEVTGVEVDSERRRVHCLQQPEEAFDVRSVPERMRLDAVLETSSLGVVGALTNGVDVLVPVPVPVQVGVYRVRKRLDMRSVRNDGEADLERKVSDCVDDR